MWKCHQSFVESAANLKPSSGESKHAVPLNFNYWSDVDFSNPIDMSDIADLISFVCAPKGPHQHPLPRYLDPSFPNAICHVALCLVNGAAGTRTPFLKSCSSVPVSFNIASDASIGDLDTVNAICSSDVHLATSLLMWPPVPSICLDCNDDNISILDLFSQYGIVFNAHHTDWADEVTFMSDTNDDSSRVAFAHTLSLHNDQCSSSLCLLQSDIFGEFCCKGLVCRGIFVLQESLSLHMFFSNEKEYVILNHAESTVNAGTHTPLSKLTFRSSWTSNRSDIILCLHSIDAKASKFSTQCVQPHPHPHPPKDVTTSREYSDDTEVDLISLSEKFISCTTKFPDAFEQAVCSVNAREILGFTLDVGAGFVSTSTWGSSSYLDASVNGGNELEEGEELSNEFSSGALGFTIDFEKLKICALDCEMCVTDQGAALTRVSVLCPLRGVLLDTLVKPERPITDYKFEYSGISEEMLSSVTTTRADVLHALSQMIDSSTIIVGHSLSSDFDALGIVHNRVVDTAALYPHKQGWPFKKSLKDLARDCLAKDIQSGEGGHSPVVDAAIALELAIHFVTTPNDYRHLLLPPPWAAQHAVVRQDRYTLYHHILKSNTVPQQGGSRCCADNQIHIFSHICRRHRYGMHLSESFCFGHGLEGDILNTHAEFKKDPYLSASEKNLFSVQETHGESTASALAALQKNVDTIEDSNASSVHLINLSCNFECRTSSCEHVTVGDACAADLDEVLSAAYDTLPTQSLFLVLSQEDIGDTKKLLAKKQRCQWFENSKRTGNISSLARGNEHCWSDSDERQLQCTLSEVSAGALYMKFT